MNLLLSTLPLDNVHRVRLYVDEIQTYTNSLNQQWMYIGLLIIPEHKIAEARRCLDTDRDECGYHRELHFTKLRNRSDASHYGEKTATAKRWVQRVVGDDQKIFHFHLFGINLSHLLKRAFGDTQRDRKFNIYNRFFRASLQYALTYFFNGEPVLVTRLCHDITQFQHNDMFDWHTIWRISSSQNHIQFAERCINFVESDHAKETTSPEDSHFIQLCDLLLGSMTQVLDNRNTKDGCNEIAAIICPLVERLVDPKQYRNRNSRFHHFRRISVSFFPSRALAEAQLNDERQRAQSSFYHQRRLLWKEQQSGQMRLELVFDTNS